MRIAFYLSIFAFLSWNVVFGTATEHEPVRVLPSEAGHPPGPDRDIGFTGHARRVPMVCDDPTDDVPTPAETNPVVSSAAPISAQDKVNAAKNPVEDGLVVSRPSEGKSLQREGRATGGLSWRDGLPLALVLGVVAAMAVLLRRFLPNQRFLTGSGVIEVVARAGLSSKQQLVLVKVGRRLVLLGVSAERINPLSEVVDPDEVATLIGAAAGDRPGSMQRAFADSFEREVRGYAEPLAEERLTESVGGQVRGLLDKLRRHTRAREAV